MPIDIERARRETPGCETVLHFNNAGSSLMPEGVLEAQIEHLQLEARLGGYESADAASDKVERAYAAAASLIGSSRDEIAIIENATRAWDMAFYSIPFKPGDRILTAKAEYASNYIAYLQVAKKYGAQVEVVPNDEHGQLSIEHLQSMLDDRVRLIAITHVPTNGGLVNPAAEIGEVARQAGVLYLLDACQSVGQLPVDVEEIGCDMLSTTGRKYLRGPRGTGFLYIRRSVLEQLEPVMLDLHAAQWTSRDTYTVRDDARRFENWETNYAAKIGLGVALDYALDWGIDSIWERVQRLAGQLRAGLSAIPGVTVRDIGKVQGGIVTFTIEGRD
ncbi:MAG: aminotransferase class V-fold PLP-dependent enzyme, partial [Dongiaceae bacterium]